MGFFAEAGPLQIFVSNHVSPEPNADRERTASKLRALQVKTDLCSIQRVCKHGVLMCLRRFQTAVQYWALSEN